MEALAAGGIDEVSGQCLARREGHGMHQDVEGVPAGFQMRKPLVDLRVLRHVHDEGDIRTQLPGERHTRSVMRSMCANASSAPWPCMAWAMPRQWNESVASPTMSARFPFKNPMFSYPCWRFESTYMTRRCPRPDLMMLIQAVPALKLGDGDLKLLGNTVHGVAAAHGVQHAPACFRALAAKAPGAGLDDQALALHQAVRRPQLFKRARVLTGMPWRRAMLDRVSPARTR